MAWPWADVAEITFLTLRVTFFATLIGTLLGVPLGAAIGLRTRPTLTLFRVLLYTLYSLPPVIAGLVGYLVLS
ncbi:MAG TPA: tungstate transporter permease, partial [Candidatus Thermoplasmatota archaeon]|nr:tungstate transporter permease [Candidatus Thermoplasmatota archaeon]